MENGRASAAQASGATSRVGGGALVVGVGLSITGIGTLLSMAFTARSLDPVQYQAFVTWWALATFFGAAFTVFEIYLSRLVVKVLSDGLNPKDVIAVISGRAWLAAIGLSCLILLLAPRIERGLFHGNVAATWLLPVFIFLAMLQCVQRGAATGYRRFGMNAGQFMTDGILRATFVTVVILSGTSSMAMFAAATCLSAACSFVVANRIFPNSWTWPTLRRSHVPWRPLWFLLIGVLSIVLINNGAVIWLSASHSVPAATLGAFAGVMTLSQIPTQLSSAVASPALSHLAYAVDVGRVDEFHRLRRRVALVTTLFGAAFTALFVLLGPEILQIYLGSRFKLARVDMAPLAAASSLMLLTLVEQSVLGARRRWGTVGLMWSVGAVAFAVTLLLPVSTLLRAVLVPGVSVAFAFAGMLIVELWTSRSSEAVSKPMAF